MKDFELLPPEKGDDLAKQINDLHATVAHCQSQSRDHLCQALIAAWQAGQMLIEQKKRVKHGNWEFWLKHNFSGSSRTAVRYMGLAKYVTDGADLEGMNIRQAYLHCGISMASSPKEPASDESGHINFLPPYLTALNRLLKALLAKGNPKQLPKSEIAILRSDFRQLHEWIASLYDTENHE